ncbi:hypothetical protein [Butyrivibrio proteoclasticus]|uniref:hypothetical protein n=1 Tax=Butyrivibrio proteoclasticus TaxID=43305 RepID=UPI00047D82B3|nr:hypothetical protein [Butyrivibrio proteoclasticus]
MKVLNNKNDYYSYMRSQKSSQSNSVLFSQNNKKSEKEASNSIGAVRKMEYEQRTAQKNSVVESSISYAQQLRASRTKAKDTALEKKKVQYSFKKISSLIVRSKDSVSARKAVQAAKREINRLKRLKGSGEYDEEEIQLAIDHAKSMEKVAKKKVSHLEQEEMVERHQHGFGAALEEIEEEKEEQEPEDSEEEALLTDEDNWDVDDEYLPESDIQYEIQQAIAEAEYEMQIQLQEMMEQMQEIAEQSMEVADQQSLAMEDFMQELSDEMTQMLEDMDLSELAESTFAPDPNMSEDDLKMLKIKHRYKELKEIAEADKEYLKGIMEHEKAKADGASAGAITGGTPSQSALFGGTSKPDVTVRVAMPGAAAGGEMVAPTISGSFDVSV